MKPIATFFTILIIGFTMNLSATNAPVSTLGVVSTNAITGTLPITVTGFTNIYSCDLKILYDQTIATATSVTLGSGVGGSLPAVNLTTPGVIRLGWLGSPSLTLGDGSVFLNIQFDKVINGTCNLSYDDLVATDCQYNGVSGTLTDTPTGTYYFPGSLTFNSNAPVITAPTLILCQNTTVNLPFTVANFNNIGAVSLKLQYNTSALTFNSGTSSVGFPGLTFGNDTPGEVVISGFNTNLSGISLSENYVLFTLNFTYPASGGASGLTWVNSGIDGVFSGPLGVPEELTDTPTATYYIDGSVSGPSSSQTVWTGGTSTAWNTAANWCGNILPTSSIDAVIPKTTTLGRMPSIGTTSSNSSASCYNLIMDAEATITIGSLITGRSGSLIVYGNASVTGTIIYNRQFKISEPVGVFDNFDWHYFSSPVGNVTATSSEFISDIYPWDEPSGDWGAGLGNTFTGFESGKGYNLDQTESSLGNISFTGSIVASTSIVATSPYTTDYGTGYPADPGSLTDYNNRIARNPFGGGGWNLLGNPFTSAMSISVFLETNDGDGTIATNKFDPNYVAVYIYDGELNQYFFRGKTTGFVDPVTDEVPENEMFGFDNIQVGQGFFVLAQKNGVSFTFDKTMQIHSTLVPLKSATIENSWPGLKLKVKSGNNENSTVVIYNDQMTTGLDPGYDIGQLSANPAVEIYTVLANNDKGISFAQQALPLAGSDKNVIQVGVDSEKGGDVVFSALTRPINNGTFYLQDKLMGTFTDLSKDSYTVTLPEKTAGAGRFYIHTSMVTGIQPVLANNELGVRIWNVNNKVNIEGSVSSKATGAIYDMLGQKIYEARLTGDIYNTITVPSTVTGVYLVKVTDGNKVAVMKVVF